jgi:S1-C subfamily serine protease
MTLALASLCAVVLAAPATAPGPEIVRIDDTQAVVSRKDARHLLAHLDLVFESVRLVPNGKDGAQSGLWLFHVVPESLLWRLGFQNGDVVSAVNDIPVSTFLQRREMPAKLRKARAFQFTGERRGAPLTRVVRIVGHIDRPPPPPPCPSWIVKNDDTHYTLAPQPVGLDGLLFDADAAGGAVHLEPEVRDDAPSGVRLFAILPGSAAACVGLRNEDVIERVNGIDVWSPKDLRELVSTKRLPDFDLYLAIARPAGPSLTIQLTVR